jgi:hypothetical protein
MNNPQQDQKIELTKNQQNPYLARPEDFDISEPDEIASRSTPFHGQCGDTKREGSQLLAKRKALGRGVTLPTSTDVAASYDIHNHDIR